jgi:hypothetical protein
MKVWKWWQKGRGSEKQTESKVEEGVRAVAKQWW